MRRARSASTTAMVHLGLGEYDDALSLMERECDARGWFLVLLKHASSGRSYRDAAREPTRRAILRLAATLVHEQVHNTDGEAAARRIQADFVRSRLDGLRGGDRRAAERYHESLESSAVAHQRAAVLARDFQRARR